MNTPDDYCPLDGNTRKPVYREPDYTIWRCDYCGDIHMSFNPTEDQ